MIERKRGQYMSALEHLEPKSVFHFFEELCKIPRGTFDTKRVSDYCVNFAKERDLEYIQDEANNVIIRKPGTEGYENSEPVILQGHLDMVCEKTEDSQHDFSKDPIEPYVEGEYITAKDTSLGGDDGIAVAYVLAVLDSNSLEHPPIEAVFTADEEVGLCGAEKIDLSVLKGKKLINIDSEEEGTIISGCAGGFRLTAEIPAERETKSGDAVEIVIRGLRGGHSGIEIDEQRGNANKLIGRILNSLRAKASYRLIEVEGGTKDNVITPAAKAVVLADGKDTDGVKNYLAELAEAIKAEFGKDEPNLEITVRVTNDVTTEVCSKAATEKVVFYIMATPDGVQGFNRELAGTVDTSLNMGVVVTKEDKIAINCMVRSSVESQKLALREKLEAFAAMVGAEVKVHGEYPAWMYRAESELREIMIETYKDMFGHTPVVATIHGGLECGLFSGKRPDLDCVSIGPNMKDVHSVNEKIEIASIQRMWNYLTEILKNCK